jgi:putative colanic acid biosynthesis glycosyltransferase
MNNNNIRITVITVAFNAKEALAKTMQSVEAQDYPLLEYIIIDGGSTDGTADMLKTYGGRLDKWVSEPDKGIYDAMNKGAAMASGDYCIFMNAGDCFSEPAAVSRAVSLFGDADVVYGDIRKDGKLKKSLSPRNCHKMYYCHQAVFTRTECLKTVPFDISHRFSADFKQAKQLFLSGRHFKQLHLVVADFDTSGISNTQRSKGLWDNIRVVYEVDSFSEKLRLLPRLLLTYWMCRLRGK